MGVTVSIKKNEPKEGVVSRTYYLDVVQSIKVSYSVKVEPISVVIKGYSGAFAMDMGVAKSYGISFTRVSPRNPNNNSNDTRDWSNAYWKKMLKEELDTWQCFSYGWVLKIEPEDDTQWLPSTDIGFISSISLPHSGGDVSRIAGSMEFTLGKMKVTD